MHHVEYIYVPTPMTTVTIATTNELAKIPVEECSEHARVDVPTSCTISLSRSCMRSHTWTTVNNIKGMQSLHVYLLCKYNRMLAQGYVRLQTWQPRLFL